MLKSAERGLAKSSVNRVCYTVGRFPDGVRGPKSGVTAALSKLVVEGHTVARVSLTAEAVILIESPI